MANPPDNQARLDLLKAQALLRSQLLQQYQTEMATRYTKDMIPFSQWMQQRKPGMAKGGSVHPMGINVASDTKAGRRYADLIVDGHKTLESRNSDTLRPYVGKRVAIVRTGEGKAKAIGEVTIGEPMVVNKKKFRSLEDEHHVPEGSAFDINTPTKHLYPMHDPVRYEEEQDVGHGIISRKVIHKADGGKVQPNIDTMKLALNKQGMYSPLEKAAMGVPRTKGTPAEFMAEVSKQPGFRKEEVADRKISLPEQKMTKDEFLGHLGKHAAPQITEVTLSDKLYKKHLDNLAKDLTGDDFTEFGDLYPNQQQDVYAMSRQQGSKFKEPQYGDYAMPGGENYREVLLKLPQQGLTDKERDQMYYLEANKRRGDIPPQHEEILQKLKAKEAAAGNDYTSQHWKDDPNVLAHLRLSDRKGPNGEKLLHIEEIQSDWHQEGRKKGYFDEDAKKKIDEFNERQKTGVPYNEALQFDAWRKNTVPDAPFKNSWHELALKHALGMAAKGGYHGIAITPGEQQAERYDLSKQISYISYNPEKNLLDAWDHNRRQVMRREITDESQLADYIGKEAAGKLLQTEPVMGKHLLEGQDLKVGGEGMKGFYDKIVPNYLNKLGKPHGAQVQMNAMPVTAPKSKNADADDQLLSDLGVETPQAKQASLHYFPITDTMRQQIKTEGLPQYMQGGIIHKAEGGNVQPTLAQMRMALQNNLNPHDIKSVGIQEAPNMSPKLYLSPEPTQQDGRMPPPGGVATPSGMPIGGIDLNRIQPGQQLMPQPQGQMAPQGPQQPQGGIPQGGLPQRGIPQGGVPQGPQMPQQGGSNILEMTPQGRALSALGGPQQPQAMADGGTAKSVEDMKAEMSGIEQGKRVTIQAEGPGNVKGIVIPRHTLEGNAKVGAVGLHEMNDARAQVYGGDHRPPMTLAKMASTHKSVLADHFAKPVDEQIKAENEALSRLRQAKHIGRTANTLDESEKLDTVRHEYDEQGRSHVGYASKGVAGHALYTSGSGKETKYHVINTCPGQTEGCGGGKDAQGIVDTKKGTCFAPNAESQYAGAATRRAAHEQAKHDPAMTSDWILAHTGSLRDAANRADKSNQRLLFRPNVVDETDVSSRHVIRHLNEQRKQDNKPPIIANSYGKTNELHDPENGYYVTHSNVGPKVKMGKEVSENIGRDRARVRNTILAADNKGDFTNEQGNKTPPKGSYMVTDVKRGSPLSEQMKKSITHAKYWTTGREDSELSPEEKAEGPEAHYSGSGRSTTEDKSHYGHKTVDGLRFDYQRQHILHPRLVQVGQNKDGTPHMIPTDSRFKDTEFLPKNRYKTKNGKDAGHILMTTPTESTSTLGHQTSFTHHVDQSHVNHAMKNRGEYVIDAPEDQIKAKGKEYSAPQSIQIPKTMKLAGGGSVYSSRHHGLNHDDFHAFPEQNFAAQRHLTMRRGDDESHSKYHANQKRPVAMHKDIDTMRLALTKKAK